MKDMQSCRERVCVYVYGGSWMILIGYSAGSYHGMCVCVYIMDVPWIAFQRPLEGHVFKSSSKHIRYRLRPVSHTFHRQDNSANRHRNKCERGTQFLADIHYSYSSIQKFHYCQKGKNSKVLCRVSCWAFTFDTENFGTVGILESWK